MADQTKTCSRCKKTKSIDGFYKDSRPDRGVAPWCKECTKAYRNQNPGTRRKSRDRWNELRRNLETWPQIAIKQIKQRAKQQGRVFDLKPEYIVVPTFCPVLGIPLIAGSEAPLDNRPSVDRFDNNLGYTKDNIRVISFRANTVKSNATADELRRVLAYVEGEI